MRCVAYYKYGKIDTSIGSMVCEMGQLGEVVVARMLDDEHRAFLQQAGLGTNSGISAKRGKA